MSKIKLVTFVFLFPFTTSYIMADDNAGKDFNPIQTAIPFLTIAPDARGGGMGDIGAATEPDVFSQYWNPAKYAFAYSKAGVSLSYTPWLAKLVSDIDLVYASGYFKLGNNERTAIGASLRYFSLGKVLLRFDQSDPGIDATPYELAADVSISLKASETFSLAAAFRYIYSDMGAGVVEELDPASAYAADIAGYYNNYVMLGNNECMLGLGFNISNIGSKISYDGGNHQMFLPANLRLGGSLLFPLDDYNTLSLNLDVNKYLVPTPPIVDESNRDAEWAKYNAISPISGIFKSFSDAPGGLKEELQEIFWSAGAEYAYDSKFFVRGGYSHENRNKGVRRYFSLGAGFKLTAFQMDVAYLISTVPSNPLDQTLRFSLSFDMDGLKNLLR